MREYVPTDEDRLAAHAAYRDGAWHWYVVVCYGAEGGEVVPHGDPRRFDFGVTAQLLARCQAWGAR